MQQSQDCRLAVSQPLALLRRHVLWRAEAQPITDCLDVYAASMELVK